MGLLIDSNALIWWLSDPQRLSRRAYAAIETAEGTPFVSAVTLYELAIKIAVHRIIPTGSSIQTILDEMRENGFELLPIRLNHLLQLEALDLHHRDPFDRLLIAQAKTEKLAIVTADKNFKKYGVKVVW